jgi:conjugal transfer/type IV secretion protein DotA/TraY
MKIIKYLLLTLCLFTNMSFAGNLSEEFKNSSKCGVGDNGFVELWSWDICEQDFSFRVFYRLFPDVMDNHMLPLTNPKFLAGGNGATSVKDFEKDHLNVYRAYEYSLMNIFKNMTSLAFFFGAILFVWHMFLALVRSSTEGSFLGEKYSFSQTAIKYGLVIIGFLPMGGGLLVIHLAVFLLIMFGIAFANLLYGIYINYMDIGSADTDANETLQDEINFDPYNADDFYSAEVAKGLLKMSMCKTVTEQYMFENNITQFTYKNWNNVKSCSAEITSKGQIYNENITGDGFQKNGSAANMLSAKSNNFTKNNGDLYLNGGLLIGRNIQNSSSCDGVVGVYNYTCGSISVSPPSMSDNKVLDLMKKIDFFSYYGQASKMINELDNASANEVKNKTTEIWIKIKDAAIKELSVDGKSEKLTPEDEIIIKNIAFYFHKLILNDSITGGLGYIKGNTSLLDNTNNKKITDTLSSLSSFSGDILDNYCTAHKEIRDKSINLKKYLDGEKVTEEKFSAACLFVSNTGETFVLGQDSTNQNVTNNKNDDYNKLRNEFKEIITDLSNKRKGIKSSLFQAVKGLDNKTVSQQMRKLGWASAGGYMLRLIKNTETDSRLMTAFDQSLSIDISKITPQMIGETYQTSKDNAVESYDNSNFSDLEQTYKIVVSPFISQRSDLKIMDVSALSESVVQDATLQKEKEEHLTTLLWETLINPFGDFKRVIGSGTNGEMLTTKTIKACIEDMSQCNVSFNNPISAITDFGNNLIKISSTMIIATAATSFLKYTAMYITNSNLQDQISKSGSISKASDDVNAVGESLAQKVGGTTGKLAYNVANFFADSKVVNVLYYILSLFINVFFVLLLLGVWFAYIIPLVPFMTFLFAFLSWVTLCLIALFVAPMWLGFNIQMSEKDKSMTDMMQSALNISLQILFRPAMTIIALVLGWSLFTVMFAIINITSMPFLASVLISDGSFSITSLVDNVLVVVIYGALIFISIKYVFSFMYKLANKLFQIINVNPIDEKSDFIENLTRSVMLSMLSKFNVLQGMGQSMGQAIDTQDAKRKLLERELNNKQEIRKQFSEMNGEHNIQSQNESDN